MLEYFANFEAIPDHGNLVVKVINLVRGICGIGYYVGDALYEDIVNEEITEDKANTILDTIGSYVVEYIGGPPSPEPFRIIKENLRSMSKVRLN